MADQPTEARLALYRKLSTEHLQTLLRSDLDGPPLDEATVDSILTVLGRAPQDSGRHVRRMAGFLRLLFHPGLPRRSGPTHPRALPEGLSPASASRSAWCPPLRPCLS